MYLRRRSRINFVYKILYSMISFVGIYLTSTEQQSDILLCSWIKAIGVLYFTHSPKQQQTTKHNHVHRFDDAPLSPLLISRSPWKAHKSHSKHTIADPNPKLWHNFRKPLLWPAPIDLRFMDTHTHAINFYATTANRIKSCSHSGHPHRHCLWITFCRSR